MTKILQKLYPKTISGYYCNVTGLADYMGLECDPGFYCNGNMSRVQCPDGFMRPDAGKSKNKGFSGYLRGVAANRSRPNGWGFVQQVSLKFKD